MYPTDTSATKALYELITQYDAIKEDASKIIPNALYYCHSALRHVKGLTNQGNTLFEFTIKKFTSTSASYLNDNPHYRNPSYNEQDEYKYQFIIFSIGAMYVFSYLEIKERYRSDTLIEFLATAHEYLQKHNAYTPFINIINKINPSITITQPTTETSRNARQGTQAVTSELVYTLLKKLNITQQADNTKIAQLIEYITGYSHNTIRKRIGEIQNNNKEYTENQLQEIDRVNKLLKNISTDIRLND